MGHPAVTVVWAPWERGDCLEPFPLSLCHSSPERSALYLQDNYLQPTGSPSQPYLSLQGLQGCQGRLLENSCAVAGGTRGFSLYLEEVQQQQPSHPLLSSANLSPCLGSVPTPIHVLGC